jgi:hypothetical protein
LKINGNDINYRDFEKREPCYSFIFLLLLVSRVSCFKTHLIVVDLQVNTRSERIDEEMDKLSEMEKGENAV